MAGSAHPNQNQISVLENLRLLDRNPDWRRDLPDSRAKNLAEQFLGQQQNFTQEECLEIRAILGKLFVDPILTLEPLCALALRSTDRRNWALAEVIRICDSWQLIEERLAPQLRMDLRLKAREFLQSLLREFPKNREIIRALSALIAKDCGVMDAILFLEQCLVLKAPIADIFLSFLAQSLEKSQNAKLLEYTLQNFDNLRAEAGYYWYVFDFHRAVILSSILEIQPEAAILKTIPRSSLVKFSNFGLALEIALENLNSLPIHIGINLLRGIGAIRLFWHSRVQGAEQARQNFISGILSFLALGLSVRQQAAVLRVLNPCLDRTEEFWRNPVFRHKIARRVLEISCSLPEPEKSFFAGRYSFILEDYDATKEFFTRYAIAKPEAHFFGSYIDHRDVGNLISQTENQYIPKLSVDFLRDVGDTAGLSLVTTANLEYFFRYALPYVESLKKFGSDFHLHFHVYGCHAEARAYLEKIVSNSEINKISLSSEEVSVNAPYYFATARFLYLSNWSKIFKAPLIVTDIDLQWHVDPNKFLISRLKNGDVGLALNHMVRSQRSSWPASSKNRYPELLSNAVRAWAVALRGNDASGKFAEILSALTDVELSRSRGRSSNSNWYIDQAILAAVYAYTVRTFPNIKFADLRDIPRDEESLTEGNTLGDDPHHWLGSPSLSKRN